MRLPGFVRILPALLAAALLLAACGVAQETPGVSLPNPVQEVASYADFAPLELFLDAPAAAENVRYSIVAEEIAQVRFSFDGSAYCCRASYLSEDISGMHAKFDAEERGVCAESTNGSVEIRIRTVDGGKAGALATWQLGAAQFTLSTTEAVTADEMQNLALMLASDAMPYYAAQTGAAPEA